jgi:hypothetical protein
MKACHNESILLNLTQPHIPQEIQFRSQARASESKDLKSAIIRQLSDRAPNQEIFTKSVGWLETVLTFAFYIHPPANVPHHGATSAHARAP